MRFIGDLDARRRGSAALPLKPQIDETVGVSCRSASLAADYFSLGSRARSR